MQYSKAKFLASYGLLKQIPPSEKPEIAFAGRSNVGKSSLINKLFNRKSLARVSAVPGKTATINFYDLPEAHFVDLPGYGYARVSKSEKIRWSELIEGYFSDESRRLVLVVSLIDMRHPPTQLDISMIDYLIDSQIPFVVALTKSDKLSARQQKERLDAVRRELPCGEDITFLPVSSEKGNGIDELKSVLEQVV